MPLATSMSTTLQYITVIIINVSQMTSVAQKARPANVLPKKTKLKQCKTRTKHAYTDNVHIQTTDKAVQ